MYGPKYVAASMFHAMRGAVAPGPLPSTLRADLRDEVREMDDGDAEADARLEQLVRDRRRRARSHESIDRRVAGREHGVRLDERVVLALTMPWETLK